MTTSTRTRDDKTMNYTPKKLPPCDHDECPPTGCSRSRDAAGLRCECGEDSTGWTEVKCCNICGRPHANETLDWSFDKMKDDEIARLVNLIRDEIEPICSNQSLRFRISKVVTDYFNTKQSQTANGE